MKILSDAIKTSIPCHLSRWNGKSLLINEETKVMLGWFLDHFDWVSYRAKRSISLVFRCCRILWMILAEEVRLTCPDFNEPFEMCTDDSECQLGSVIAQQGEPIAHFSRELNESQQNCTVMELELLAMVETLKECRSISLGQDITACTDHENLTHKVFNAERVMRWRLLVEEFGPKLVYVKGDTNVVADALSGLHMEPAPKSPSDESALETPDHRLLAESFLQEEIPDDLSEWTTPMSYELSCKEQHKDKSLQQSFLENKNNHCKLRGFCWNVFYNFNPINQPKIDRRTDLLKNIQNTTTSSTTWTSKIPPHHPPHHKNHTFITQCHPQDPAAAKHQQNTSFSPVAHSIKII